MSSKCIHCNNDTILRLCDTCLKDDTITITQSKARKHYKLSDADLSNLGVTKRRYYISDIEDNLVAIKEKKEFERINSQKKLEEERKERKNSFTKYISDKSPEFTQYVLTNCRDITELYYKGTLIEDLDTALKNRYKEHQQKKEIKK
jgi:hypothetical protein